MRFITDVHVPGKEIMKDMIADTLSRNPIPHTSNDKDILEAVAVFVDGMESHWPVTPQRLQILHSTAVHDPEMLQVIKYLLNGWPARSLQAYHQAQGKLSLINGLLVYNGRIVVPSSQCWDILGKLHETHQGLHKCRHNTQTAVWWPGLSTDLKNLIYTCRVCHEHRPSQRSEALRPTPLPEHLWQQLGANLCSFQGKDYLVVVDNNSRLLEILPLHTMTAAIVIKKFTQLFTMYGILDSIISDNGPQFQCSEFREFTLEFNFDHQPLLSPGQWEG